MSRYDREDPGTDPTYCDGLEPIEEQPGQEECSYCHEFYDTPVSLHHTAYECARNINKAAHGKDFGE